MNRRSFISTLVGGVAVNSAVRMWPFRVFSFPSEQVSHPFAAFVGSSGLRLLSNDGALISRIDLNELMNWGKTEIKAALPEQYHHNIQLMTFIEAKQSDLIKNPPILPPFDIPRERILTHLDRMIFMHRPENFLNRMDINAD